MSDAISSKAIKRSLWLGIFIFAGFAVLLIRVLAIQTVQFKEYQDKVLSQITTETPIEAKRGDILDCNGNVLANTVQTYRVFICPAGIKDAMNDRKEGDTTDYEHLVAKGLEEILDADYDNVREQITKYSNKLDRTIKRKVDKETFLELEAYVKENKLNGMIYAQPQDTRHYPNGSLASHVLGFSNTDGDGLYGLEYQYNEYLSGVDGYYITARDSYGDEMAFDYTSIVEAVDGYNLHTTIDISIQSYLEEQLEAAVLKSEAANRACGIVMDVNTGAIKAMATTGGFNLNDPWALDALSEALLAGSGYKEGSDEYSELQRKLLTEMWSNKAVAESYIPGSTFKIITSSIAVEENEGEIPSSVTCKGYLIQNGQRIKCHKVEGHGPLSFARGLQQSCNVWFMTLGDLIGVDNFTKYVKAFGYMEKTGIDLPGEASGIFSSELTHLDLVIYAFGQNFNVTPIQQITGISAVANGGRLVTPYLVDKITDNGGNVIYQHDTEVKRQVVSEEVCEKISVILEEGVSGDGGAKNAGVNGYLIAAKTGTSEKKETGHKTTLVSDYKNMTAADAKALIEEVGLTCEIKGSSSKNAKVVSQIPAVGTKIVVENGIVVLYTSTEASASVRVPSVKGKTLDEAKRLLKEAGLNFTIEGTRIHSEIQTQSVSAGTIVEKGSVVKLTFGEGYVCSTVAYAPADDPEIAIIIIVDEPTKGSLYGSTVAAPYVSGALKNILPYLGYEPNIQN